MEFAVLSRVRVKTNVGTWKRANVSLCNDDGTVDIIYDDGGDEIFGVSLENLRPLEPFELDGTFQLQHLSKNTTVNDIESSLVHVKECANELFRLPDYDAAADGYRTALETLSLQYLRPGADCRVLGGRGASGYQMATIVCCDDETADVMYEETDGQASDDEETVPLLRLLPIVPFQLAVLHTALLLNLAKCYSALGLSTQVIDTCTAAVAVGRHHLTGNIEHQSDNQTNKELRRLCANAFSLRSRTHLAAGRIKQAKKDCELYASAAGTTGDESLVVAAEKLSAEIDRKGKALRQKDRQLARDVGAWVETSMQTHEKVAASKGGIEESKGGIEEDETPGEQKTNNEIVDDAGACVLS